MANVAVSGTLITSSGKEIPLYVASVAEGTESNLTTSTQSNFTVSASAVGTAFAGETISSVAGPIMAKNGCAYAYLLRAGNIIQIYPVGVAGCVTSSTIQLCNSVTLIAGDQVRVMANTAADREFAFSVYTNQGVSHVFAITPTTGATNNCVSVLTGNDIGTTLQGNVLTKVLCTSVDGTLLAPSGNGCYVVDDRNNIVGAVQATNPIKEQSQFAPVSIPIGLNYQAQAITSA
jgi:hypothetical protein